MKKLFIPEPLTDVITIPKDLTHHLVCVFRHDLSKPIMVSGSDKRTGSYQIDSIMDDKANAHVIAYLENESDFEHVEIVLVQAFLKADKFEWVLQKATEIGVDTIYGVATQNCVARYEDKKLKVKVERWKKILQEASQQCGRATLPDLLVEPSLREILDIEKDSLCLLADVDELELTLKEILKKAKNNRTQPIIDNDANRNVQNPLRIVVFIGPEGSFSQNELALFKEKEVPFVSLGRHILRAETAAIVAVSIINYEMNIN